MLSRDIYFTYTRVLGQYMLEPCLEDWKQKYGICFYNFLYFMLLYTRSMQYIHTVSESVALKKESVAL